MKQKFNTINIEISWAKHRHRNFGTNRRTDWLITQRLIRLGRFTITIVKDYDNFEEYHDLQS